MESLKKIRDALIEQVTSHIDCIDCISTCEMAEAINAIHRIEEAIYYHILAESMEEATPEEVVNIYKEMKNG